MDLMDIAIKESRIAVSKDHGGPFGACIVRKGELISKSHNMVLKNNDPTAHAEINVIRQACKKLKTYNLSECELYTTSEPCPMCYGAILWSKIPTIYVGIPRSITSQYGFEDERLYQEFQKGERDMPAVKIIMMPLLFENKIIEIFNLWKELKRKLY